jgi:hypothetical protein
MKQRTVLPGKNHKWTYSVYEPSNHLIFTAYQVYYICKPHGQVYCEDTWYETYPPTPIQDLNLPRLGLIWDDSSAEVPDDFTHYIAKVDRFAKHRVINATDQKLVFMSSKKLIGRALGKDYIENFPVKHFAQAVCFDLLSGKRQPLSGLSSWSWKRWDISSSGSISYPEYVTFESSTTFYHVQRTPGRAGFQFLGIGSTHRAECFRFPRNIPIEKFEHIIEFQDIDRCAIRCS